MTNNRRAAFDDEVNELVKNIGFIPSGRDGAKGYLLMEKAT